jgi:hypothetical protein
MSSQSEAEAQGAKPQILELRMLRMRNTRDGMAQRTNEFLQNAWLPALKRSGVNTVGAFGSVIAPDGPFALVVTSYPSMAAWESNAERIAADEALRKARESYYNAGLGYTRAEITLLRGFRTVPGIEVPQVGEGKPPRVFEIRTYESDNPHSLAKKIKMFDDGEIGIFRRLGMKVVFFGETIAGRNMPNLTYMLGYDDLAHREKVWADFVKDPEWLKMRATPGLSDGEVVSNISNVILRPLPFSSIR